MKIRLILASLLCAVTFASGLRAADEPKTPLGEQMEKINAANRKLGRGAVNDASKNEASLAAVAEMKAAFTEALKYDPKNTADLPAADRAKHVEGYKAEVKKVIAELDKLAAALKAGKNEEAATIYAAIGQMQKDDHKIYKAPVKK
jgi:cytochrome c556